MVAAMDELPAQVIHLHADSSQIPNSRRQETFSEHDTLEVLTTRHFSGQTVAAGPTFSSGTVNEGIT